MQTHPTKGIQAISQMKRNSYGISSRLEKNISLKFSRKKNVAKTLCFIHAKKD